MANRVKRNGDGERGGNEGLAQTLGRYLHKMRQNIDKNEIRLGVCVVLYCSPLGRDGNIRG